MSVQWYHRRIRKLFAEIARASELILPANRLVVGNFIVSWHLHVLEDILSGLQHTSAWDDCDWDSDITFLKFKDYIVDQESKLEQALRSVRYCIDEENTLAVMTGGGRPEKVLIRGA